MYMDVEQFISGVTLLFVRSPGAPTLFLIVGGRAPWWNSCHLPGDVRTIQQRNVIFV